MFRIRHRLRMRASTLERNAIDRQQRACIESQRSTVNDEFAKHRQVIGAPFPPSGFDRKTGILLGVSGAGDVAEWLKAAVC
jgi:hypothetical protein